MSRQIKIESILAAVLCLVMAFFQPVTAQEKDGYGGNALDLITSVPRNMTYQGIIKGSGEDPVTDSVYNVTFRVFDVEMGGVSLWNETLPCTTSAGVFFTAFSNVNLPFDEDYWLELEVGGEILDPRQKLSMVGYAARADTADYALVTGGGGANGWLDDGNVVRLESDTDDVGIGTAAPSEKLHIEGNLYVSGKAAIGSGNTNTGAFSFVAGQNNSAGGDWSTVSGGDANSAADYWGTIGGGSNNTVTSSWGTIAGGSDNAVNGQFAAIAGGYADTIAAGADYSYLFGIGSKLTQDSTFMVEMPHIRFGDEATGYEFPVSDGASGQVMSTDGSGQLSWSDGADSVSFAFHSENANNADKLDNQHGTFYQDASNLTAGVLSENRLPQNSIDNSEIEDNSITSSDIQDNTISSNDIAFMKWGYWRGSNNAVIFEAPGRFKVYLASGSNNIYVQNLSNYWWVIAYALFKDNSTHNISRTVFGPSEIVTLNAEQYGDININISSETYFLFTFKGTYHGWFSGAVIGGYYNYFSY